MTLHEMSKTKTTAEIVRHYRDAGEIDFLLSQLHTLPKGEQLAIESCLAGEVGAGSAPVRYRDEFQDIANEMCGI